MEFKTFDRLILLNILPEQADITTIRIIHKLRQDLSFSEEEHAALEIQTGEDGLVRWNAAADTSKDVEIGPKAHAIVEGVLRQLSEKGLLREQHLPLYDRFVEVT